MDEYGGLLLELLLVDLGQSQHVALRQRVGKLVVALLLDGLHLDLAGGVEQGVDPGVDDPGVALEDAVEHLDALLGELPGAVEIVFFILLFRLQGRCVQIHLPAASRVEQGIDLTL